MNTPTGTRSTSADRPSPPPPGLVGDVRISLVLPAFNEEANLERVVESAVQFLRRLSAEFEIIIVNDGSTDGTAELIRSLAGKHAEITGIHHPVNRGYGASLRNGFAAGRYEWLFFTDSDHQFRIDSLIELLPLRSSADVVVGFRKRRQDPVLRRVLSWGYNQLMRFAFGVQVRDIDCAFKLLRRDLVETITIESDRFFVNTELLVKLRAEGARIVEVGVDHFPREIDRSKVRLAEIPRTLREVLRIWRQVYRKG